MNERIYDDKNEIKCVSLVSCAKHGDDYIISIIHGSNDFYYCNNSYIDMKRITENILKNQHT